MKPWATKEQREWLKEQIPDWHKRRGRGDGFFKDICAKFLLKFPDADNPLLQEVRTLFPPPTRAFALTSVQRIRQWFYNHSKSSSSKPVVQSVLSVKAPRKVVPLSKAQAYGLLYCKWDSSLHEELREAWDLYIANDKATVNKYKHLFPQPHNPSLMFVTFQQAVIREKVACILEEEEAELREYIDTRFQKEKNVRENPWMALKADDTQSDHNLEGQYVRQWVPLSVVEYIFCS